MYRIGICDDDFIFCAQIEKYLEEFAREEKVTIDIEVFLSGEDYLKYMEQKRSLDILFLDIELGGIDGISVGQKIRDDLANEVTQIVYVSSKQNYAISLFQIRPMDFLVKPIERAKINRIMQVYRRLFDGKKKFFEFHVGRSNYRVATNRIMYFQCEGKKIRIVTVGNESSEFYEAMKNIEKQLDMSIFCVIHKSYIVNVNYVSEFHIDEVVMTTGIILPISQTMRKKVRQKILEQNVNSR
ncbi:MAG: response regulator transcription factor [Lachnospiraceae bacterium]|nr:response regulator transcription factor [Lachnospiraceae bacterium]